MKDHYFLTAKWEPNLNTGGRVCRRSLWWGTYRLKAGRSLDVEEDRIPSKESIKVDEGVGALEKDRLLRVKAFEENAGRIPSLPVCRADGKAPKPAETREEGQLQLMDWARSRKDQ